MTAARRNVTDGSVTAPAAVSAVLVGCGAMSRAWLEAARQIDGLTITGLVDIDIERARSRAAEFGLDKAMVDTDLASVIASGATRCSLRRGRAGSARRCRHDGHSRGMPCAHRKAARRQPL